MWILHFLHSRLNPEILKLERSWKVWKPVAWCWPRSADRRTWGLQPLIFIFNYRGNDMPWVRANGRQERLEFSWTVKIILLCGFLHWNAGQAVLCFANASGPYDWWFARTATRGGTARLISKQQDILASWHTAGPISSSQVLSGY